MATVPYFSLVDEDFTRKLTEEATSDDADHQEDRKLMYYMLLEEGEVWYTKRGPPQGSVRIEVWFTNMADGDKVDELTKGIQECICTRLDGTLGGNPPKCDLKTHGDEDDDADRQYYVTTTISSLTTVTSASSDIAQLREELVSLRRLIQKAYPVLEVNPLYNGNDHSVSTTSQRGEQHWLVVGYHVAVEGIREVHAPGYHMHSKQLTRRPIYYQQKTIYFTMLFDYTTASKMLVSYLLNEHIYPSMDNISLCLHLAFSLRSITLNDILTCAKFGVEDGRLIISGDVILLPYQAPWSDTSSNDATTVFTCYPSKYTPYPSDAGVANKMDEQLLARVDSFYDHTMIGVSPAGEHPSPFRLALLAKKFAADMVVTTASMGLLIWLFQRCIAKDNTNTPLPAPSDSSTLLLRCHNPQCPLWPECCGHQSFADGTTRKKRPIVELRTILIDGGKDVSKAHGDPDNGHSSSRGSSSSSQVGDEVLPNSATHIAAEGRIPAAESGKHRPSTEIQHDDTALAREQLLFIHCFKNELLAGQGILLNQVNNLCKVRCGRTVRYREFGFGKLRDFLEDIKGLQVVGEKFQMTIRLTDVVEFDLFIREANARKSAGGRSSTASPVIGVTKRGGPLAESDGGNMVGDALPQLIPEDVIDKLRYMFSCEHYQIEASVFVSLFKNRYFATDPMVYERLGYKRMRDFLGAVPQVHKQGTKAEAKYVWVENSAPLRLPQLGVASIGGQEGSNNNTAIDFLHSATATTTSSSSSSAAASSSFSNNDTFLGDAGLLQPSLSLDNTALNTIEDILNQSSTDGVQIAVADLLTGICGGASSGLERLIGFNLAGANIYKLIHPDDSVSVRLRIDEAMAIGLKNVDLSTFRLRSTTCNNNTITVSGTASWLMGNVWTISLLTLS
ncbi:hypothetical protein FOZ60_008485 [Perkinsus olseni]|uniref:HTH OST-type domain-containing protein n=1 Tax=Perkinsus olseni TaxID=32597 RepID=A0A7J6PDY2_PEROL|nr:hypothetical protein FOZ60_008485 [Perkinsus olseni]